MKVIMVYGHSGFGLTAVHFKATMFRKDYIVSVMVGTAY